MVVHAGGEGDAARDALAALCQIYQPPVLAYFRAHARDGEDPEDLTQAFFAHLLEQRLAARADRERGRFRAYLLTSVKHFLSSERERERAQRRGGGVQRLPAAVIESVADDEEGPEQAFDREWARTVLRESIRRLGDEVSRAGRTDLFKALRPFLIEAPEAGEYDAVARELGLRHNTVAVAVHRMRARLQALVREVVADTAEDGEEVDDELRRMRGVLTPDPPEA